MPAEHETSDNESNSSNGYTHEQTQASDTVSQAPRTVVFQDVSSQFFRAGTPNALLLADLFGSFGPFHQLSTATIAVEVDPVTWHNGGGTLPQSPLRPDERLMDRMYIVTVTYETSASAFDAYHALNRRVVGGSFMTASPPAYRQTHAFPHPDLIEASHHWPHEIEQLSTAANTIPVVDASDPAWHIGRLSLTTDGSGSAPDIGPPPGLPLPPLPQTTRLLQPIPQVPERYQLWGSGFTFPPRPAPAPQEGPEAEEGNLPVELGPEDPPASPEFQDEPLASPQLPPTPPYDPRYFPFTAPANGALNALPPTRASNIPALSPSMEQYQVPRFMTVPSWPADPRLQDLLNDINTISVEAHERRIAAYLSSQGRNPVPSARSWLQMQLGLRRGSELVWLPETRRNSETNTNDQQPVQHGIDSVTMRLAGLAHTGQTPPVTNGNSMFLNGLGLREAETSDEHAMTPSQSNSTIRRGRAIFIRLASASNQPAAVEAQSADIESNGSSQDPHDDELQASADNGAEEAELQEPEEPVEQSAPAAEVHPHERVSSASGAVPAEFR